MKLLIAEIASRGRQSPLNSYSLCLHAHVEQEHKQQIYVPACLNINDCERKKRQQFVNIIII